MSDELVGQAGVPAPQEDAPATVQPEVSEPTAAEAEAPEPTPAVEVVEPVTETATDVAADQAEASAEPEPEPASPPATEAAPAENTEHEPAVEAEIATEPAAPDAAPATEAETAEEQAAPELADAVNADELVADSAQAGETDRTQLKAVIEAVVYITDEPLTAQQIAGALDRPLDLVKQILSELVEDYSGPERGLSIREIAGGYKTATKPEHHEAVRTFVKNLKAPLKLSLAALETLAVIAYKQPCTGPEIMEIRGVQGLGVLKTLIDRKLIATAGRKNVVGKPILYKTTKDFLIQFGLKDLAELPTLKEFEELGRLALSDGEPEAAPVAATPAEPAETPAAPVQEPPVEQPPRQDPPEPQEPPAQEPPVEEPPAPSEPEKAEEHNA